MKNQRTCAIRGALRGALAVGLATTALLAAAAVPATAAPGQIIGARQFGGSGWDEPIVLRVDDAGNLYTGGATSGALFGAFRGGEEDGFVAKFSPTGTVLWVHHLGTADADETNDVVPLPDGGVYAGGLRGAYGAERVGWLARFSGTGAVTWWQWLSAESLGLDAASGGINLRAIMVDGAGNALVAIRTEPSSGPNAVFLLRYAPDGELLWQTQVPNPTEGPNPIDVPEHGLAIDSAGNFYAIGIAGPEAFVAKYRADDTLEWLNPIATTGNVSAYGLAVDGAGNVYAGGQTGGSLFGTNRGEDDIWVLAFDPAGNPRWQRQFGTSAYDDLWDLTLDAAGDVYLTGGTRGSLAGPTRGGEDIWTAKLVGATGRGVWGRQIGTAADDYGTAVAVSGTTLYLMGDTTGALAGANRGDEDAVLLRISTE